MKKTVQSDLASLEVLKWKQTHIINSSLKALYCTVLSDYGNSGVLNNFFGCIYLYYFTAPILDSVLEKTIFCTLKEAFHLLHFAF